MSNYELLARMFVRFIVYVVVFLAFYIPLYVLVVRYINRKK